MEEAQLSTFGEILTAFRKQRKITQHELAMRIGVHRNTIGIWERGDFLPESKTIVLELAHCLHLNTQEERRLLEASMTALSPYWHMPYQRNPFFTGREEVLQELHNVLSHERRIALLSQSYALSGLGGIGKTQTAIEYAYRYANNYSAIFWISAETDENIISNMVTIAMLLNLSEQQEQDMEKVVSAVTRWLTNHSNWLLILDNVEDPALVKRFLPSARNGALLFTTRLQSMGTLAQILTLPLMSPHEGTHLLLHRAHLLGLETLPLQRDENVAAQIIVQEMGGLPLALDQAGAYIQATGCSFSAFLALLHSEFVFLLQQREEFTDYPYSVATMVTLAFQKLQMQDSLAAQLLKFCTFLAPDAIPEILFQKWITYQNDVTPLHPQQLQELFKAILTYALLSRTEQPGTFTMHRLVQIILRTQTEQKEQKDFIDLAVLTINQSFPKMIDISEHTTRQLCQSLLPHVEMCMTFVEQTGLISSEAGQLFQKAGVYFREYAEYDKAERYLRKARDIWTQMKGTNAFDLADTLCHLALLCYRQGKYQPMEAFLSESAVLLKEYGGQDQTTVANTYQMLGVLFMRQGKYETAEGYLKQTLDLMEHQWGPEHAELIGILECLTEVYRKQQNYETAASFGQRALAISTLNLGAEHPYIASILNSLALIYRDQQKYREAEDLFKQSLALYTQIVGPEHPNIAAVTNSLGVLYAYQKRWSDAKPLFQQALQIRETLLGPEHPDTARSLFDLAESFRAEQQYTQAELLYQRSLRIRKQIWGSKHPSITESLESLATVYAEQGKYLEAQPLYWQVLTIHEQTLAPDHPKTRKIRSDYAQLLHKLEQANIAKQLGSSSSIQEAEQEVPNNAEGISVSRLSTPLSSNVPDAQSSSNPTPAPSSPAPHTSPHPTTMHRQARTGIRDDLDREATSADNPEDCG